MKKVVKVVKVSLLCMFLFSGCEKLKSIENTSKKDLPTENVVVDKQIPELTSEQNITIVDLDKSLSSKEIYSKLTEEELKLVKELNATNKLISLKNAKAREVAKKALELYNLESILISLDDDGKEYPELTKEQKELLTDIESKNQLDSLSESTQTIWSRSKLLESLPKGTTIVQVKKLNEGLLNKDIYSKLEVEDLELVEKLHSAGKLDLLNVNSRGVAERGLMINNLNNDLMLLDKDSRDYPELLDIQKNVLLRIDRSNKLDSLSKNTQYIWSRIKLLEDLPSDITIVQVNDLNKSLSNKEVYSLLAEEDLSLVEKLNLINKLDLLVNANAREVAKKAIAVYNLEKALLLLDNASKEYPQLTNEQKTLFIDIESKNKLNSLSKVAQAIWTNSKKKL